MVYVCAQTIRAWPPTTTAKGSFPFQETQVPAAFRQLLKARSTVAPSGVASIEYDLAMLGFAWLQTLFDDYWTLARSACGLVAGGGVTPEHPGLPNSTTALPCQSSHPLAAGASQSFIEVPGKMAGTVQLQLDDKIYSGLCIDSSCYTGSCYPARLLPCAVLGNDALFIKGADGSLTGQVSGKVLDFGVYCSGCKPMVGLAEGKINVDGHLATWQIWNVSSSDSVHDSLSVRAGGGPKSYHKKRKKKAVANTAPSGTVYTHPQHNSGSKYCLTAENLGPQLKACPDAIRTMCGETGNDCINCCEKNAAVLGLSCKDLNSQMHGVCGAMTAHPSAMRSSTACNASADAALGLILDLDEFLGNHHKFLLGTWLRDSKDAAADAEDAANLEYGARNLLTLWCVCAAVRLSCKQWPANLLIGYLKLI